MGSRCNRKCRHDGERNVKKSEIFADAYKLLNLFRWHLRGHFCNKNVEFSAFCLWSLFKYKRVARWYFLLKSAPSIGCFSFGPEHIQSPDIWSPTIGPQEQTVPAHLVPMDKWSPRQLVPLDNWSPNIWSPWTNGPQDNWSPWTIGPQNLLVVSKSGLKHFYQFFDI